MEEDRRLGEVGQGGTAPEFPKALNSLGKRALYNSLGQDEAPALRINNGVKRVRYDEWGGNVAKEQAIRRELYSIRSDDEAVERVSSIVREQKEY